MSYNFSKMRAFLSLLLLVALVMSLTVNFSACTKKAQENQEPITEEQPFDDTPNLNVEPANSLTVKIYKEDGTVRTFSFKTNAMNLGDALVNEGIASGEQGADGWVLDTFDGETHKDDGKQWVLYVDGYHPPKGVSSVMVNAASDCFEFRVEAMNE